MRQDLAEEVHLWKASLDVEPFELSTFEKTLSDDERARAARFCLQKHKGYFVAARGILRTILSCYLKEDPDQLQFKYGRYGKPALNQTGSPGADICFNLSHSAGLLLVVVSAGRELGIDLEQIQPALVSEEMVKEVFPEHEQAMFYALNAALQPKMFFEQWVRKEAYLKARGIGLSVPLNQLKISSTSGEGSLCLEGDEAKESDWTIHPLDVSGEYSACLVVKGNGWQLKYFERAR